MSKRILVVEDPNRMPSTPRKAMARQFCARSERVAKAPVAWVPVMKDLLLFQFQNRQWPHRGHQQPRQAAKAKARGYRSLRNLIAITYLIAGKIDLKLAT